MSLVDEVAGERHQLDVLVLGDTPQHRERLIGVQPVALHQNPLRLTDHRPGDDTPTPCLDLSDGLKRDGDLRCQRQPHRLRILVKRIHVLRVQIQGAQ